MIAGLVLAAGESSRIGADKALLRFHGRTFLETILQTLRDAGLKRIAVVLGHHAEEIQRALDLENIEVVINPDYRRGQTSSLQAGLEALAGTEIEAVVLCLVDHPAVAVETIRQLIAAFQQSGAPVVVPTYKGQRGHPVVIGRALFGELSVLNAGDGANAVIRKYRDQTQFLPVEDDGILLDVDDPESYRRLNSP